MLKSKSVVQRLIDFGKNNQERAFSILGSRPGPGFDLLIRPVEPLCGKWHVDGLTKCGYAFIAKFWEFQPLSNQKVAELRKQANEWGLTYQTKYNFISLENQDG